MDKIYFAGGCFWGVEKYFSLVPKGILDTKVGYVNGKIENPTYEDVCKGTTGFVEAVEVVYDKNQISLAFLLQLFYKIIDPFTLNRQGNDVGTQYRSGIYYLNEADKEVIEKSLEELTIILGEKVVIEALPLESFYKAEEYHQKYLVKNPTGYCHIPQEYYNQVKRAIVDKTQYEKPSKEKLKNILSKEAYLITQKGNTEKPFENSYWNFEKEGIYVDVTTGEPLFLSTEKYDAGCGWPSFTKPIDPNVIEEFMDFSFGKIRTEVKSRVGEAHLGHVFEDGPKEKGGLRYCINSGSIKFIPLENMKNEGYEKYIDLLKEDHL